MLEEEFKYIRSIQNLSEEEECFIREKFFDGISSGLTPKESFDKMLLEFTKEFFWRQSEIETLINAFNFVDISYEE